MTPRRLTSEQKLFVVRRLSIYETPAEVIAAFKAVYGWAPSNQSLASYDPDCVNGRRDLGPELTKVFEDTRKEFRANGERIAIAQRAFRLTCLDRMVRKAEQAGDLRTAADILAQAAKEVGDVYTNLQRMGGPQGQPLPSNGTVLLIPDNGRNDDPDAASEKREARAMELLERAATRMHAQAPAVASSQESLPLPVRVTVRRNGAS